MTSVKKLSFPAGCMTFDPETKKVRADARQGKLVLEKNSNDEKVVRWVNEKTNIAENEIYVFSGDALFDKVRGAPSRVYYLHFNTFGDKYFFWFQGADETKDEQHKKLINNFINDIEEEKKPQSAFPGGLPASMNLGSGLFQGMPRNLRGQATGATGGAASGTDYQSLMASLQSMNAGGRPAAGAPGANPFAGMQSGQQVEPVRRTSPSFVDVFNSSYIAKILQDEAMKTELIQLLPEGQQNAEGLRESLRSAQFQQALEAVEQALMSEEGISVLKMLGFDEKFYMEARTDGLEALFRAVLDKYGKKN